MPWSFFALHNDHPLSAHKHTLLWSTQVNIVNADLLAKKRGLRIVETSVPSEGTAALTGMTVSIVSAGSRFSSALNSTGQISVSGAVKGGKPFLTQIGGFDLDLEAEVRALFFREGEDW